MSSSLSVGVTSGSCHRAPPAMVCVPSETVIQKAKQQKAKTPFPNLLLVRMPYYSSRDLTQPPPTETILERLCEGSRAMNVRCDTFGTEEKQKQKHQNSAEDPMLKIKCPYNKALCSREKCSSSP